MIRTVSFYSTKKYQSVPPITLTLIGPTGWTHPVQNWNLTLSQLAIHFEGRLDGHLALWLITDTEFWTPSIGHFLSFYSDPKYNSYLSLFAKLFLLTCVRLRYANRTYVLRSFQPNWLPLASYCVSFYSTQKYQSVPPITLTLIGATSLPIPGIHSLLYITTKRWMWPIMNSPVIEHAPVTYPCLRNYFYLHASDYATLIGPTCFSFTQGLDGCVHVELNFVGHVSSLFGVV